MVYIDIAGIKTKLNFTNSDLLGKNFDDFISEELDYLSNIKLKVYNAENSCSFANGIHPKNKKILIKRKGNRGYFDIDTMEGELESSSEVFFELYLRILYSLVLPINDGLAIHASSLVKKGKAYIFPGKSGSGKTTIVQSSPDTILLTDEISIIRIIQNKIIAYGTPFHGDQVGVGKNINATLEGLYFPIKDKRNYLKELTKKTALRKILTNVVSYGKNQSLVQKIFSLSYEIVSSLPCYDLHFLPDSSFWSCIEERERNS